MDVDCEFGGLGGAKCKTSGSTVIRYETRHILT
jgi:hypothetical protein